MVVLVVVVTQIQLGHRQKRSVPWSRPCWVALVTFRDNWFAHLTSSVLKRRTFWIFLSTCIKRTSQFHSSHYCGIRIAGFADVHDRLGVGCTGAAVYD